MKRAVNFKGKGKGKARPTCAILVGTIARPLAWSGKSGTAATSSESKFTMAGEVNACQAKGRRKQ